MQITIDDSLLLQQQLLLFCLVRATNLGVTQQSHAIHDTFVIQVWLNKTACVGGS